MPPAPAPRGLAEIRRAFGDVKIRIGAGRWEIVEPVNWEDNNCVVIPDFPGLGRKLYVHKLLVGPLRAALALWQLRCPDYAIRTIGCFNPRPKRVVRACGLVGWDEGLSMHAVAGAVDINADTNPMRTPLTCDMPAEFIACFTDVGFTWGGKFPTPDPQHMQWASGY